MSASDVTDGHQRLVQRRSGVTGSVAQHSHLPSAITPVIERMLQVCCSDLGATAECGGGGGGAFGLIKCHIMFVLWQLHVSCQSRSALRHMTMRAGAEHDVSGCLT